MPLGNAHGLFGAICERHLIAIVPVRDLSFNTFASTSHPILLKIVLKLQPLFSHYSPFFPRLLILPKGSCPPGFDTVY